MAAAPWYAPPADGVTFWHVTDTHVDMPREPGLFEVPWSMTRLGAIVKDLDRSGMVGRIDSRVHTGDICDDAGMIDGWPEMVWARDWLNAHMGTDQDVWVLGNHDYGNGADTIRRNDWETFYGRSILSDTYVTGADGSKSRVLGFAPNLFLGGWQWTMPPETMAWLDERLQADQTTPVVLACHYTFPELIPGQNPANNTQPYDGFADLIGSYPVVKAAFTGHNHRDVTSEYTAVEYSIGGRTIAHLNGPSTVFTRGTHSQTARDPYTSLIVTLRDEDRVEVRRRNHGAHKWVTGSEGEHVTVLHPSP